MTRRLRAGVSATETDYGCALLDLDTGNYFNLNPTGALVLQRLLDGDSPEQAATRLTEEYAVAREEAEQDVAALVRELEAAGLIEATPDQAPDEAVPDEAVPDGTGPDGTTPEGTGPGGTVLDGLRSLRRRRHRRGPAR
jgi:hypothetical protein